MDLRDHQGKAPKHAIESEPPLKATTAVAERCGPPYAEACTQSPDADHQIYALVAHLSNVSPIKLVPINGVGEILGLTDSARYAPVASGELHPDQLGRSRSGGARARRAETGIFAYAYAWAEQRELPFSSAIDTGSPADVSGSTKGVSRPTVQNRRSGALRASRTSSPATTHLEQQSAVQGREET